MGKQLSSPSQFDRPTLSSLPLQSLSSRANSQVSQSELSTQNACEIAFEAIIDQNGLDPFLYDVRDATDIADYLIVVSATSDRHVQGIIDHVERALAKHGEIPTHGSGQSRTRRQGSKWKILDYGDFIVHVFHEEARQFYNLDQLWSAGKIVALSEKLEARAKRLRTGMFLPRKLVARS